MKPAPFKKTSRFPRQTAGKQEERRVIGGVDGDGWGSSVPHGSPLLTSLLAVCLCTSTFPPIHPLLVFIYEKIHTMLQMFLFYIYIYICLSPRFRLWRQLCHSAAKYLKTDTEGKKRKETWEHMVWGQMIAAVVGKCLNYLLWLGSANHKQSGVAE